MAAVAAGVPNRTLNYLGAGYLASRVAYNAVYIVLQENRKLAPLRSVMYFTGVGLIVSLWVKAGNAAAEALLLQV